MKKSTVDKEIKQTQIYLIQFAFNRKNKKQIIIIIIFTQKMIKFQGQEVANIDPKYIIISSVSFSNTPSRALDILIASNQFKRVGFLDSKHIQPAVGYLSKNVEHGSLGLPAEIYVKDDVLILQLRSNVRVGRKKQFVEQIAKLFSKYLQSNNVLVVGSLPYSLRPDLQIQSISKNTYYYSKSQNAQLKKAEENNLIKPINLLIQKDEEATDILGDIGFIKNIIKSQKFPKIDYLCVFSEKLIDHDAAVKLAKSISIVSGKKQLGKIDQAILDS